MRMQLNPYQPQILLKKPYQLTQKTLRKALPNVA